MYLYYLSMVMLQRKNALQAEVADAVIAKGARRSVSPHQDSDLNTLVVPT